MVGSWRGRALNLLVVGAVLTAYVFYAAFLYSYAETSVSPWFKPGAPTLEKLDELRPDQPYPYSINGNVDCTQHKFVTRPKRLLPIPQSELSHEACAVQSALGYMNTNGYIHLLGTATAGRFFDVTGQSRIIPVPSSTDLLTYSSAFNGMYLFLTKNAHSAINYSVSSTGEVTYRLNRPPDIALRKYDGSLLQFRYESMSFSENGQWMVADVPSYGTVRINLRTLEILPFGPSFNYNIGLGPNLQTAISGDGRYAVVASVAFNAFTIYDLSSCAVDPKRPTGYQSCQSRELYKDMEGLMPGFKHVTQIRFNSNHTLKLYVAYTEGGANKRVLAIMAAPGENIVKYEYLGLGDSFSSGEGAYLYKVGTDTKQNKCHLSQASYPYLVAQELGLNTYNSVACSGAIIEDIVSTSLDYDKENAQSKGKDAQSFNEEIYQNFMPGYRVQRSFVENYRPSVMTISTVGNDVGFGDKVRRCLEPDTCFNTYEDRVEIVQEVNGKYQQLVDMYKDIKESAAPKAKVYVLGYPELAMPDGNCGVNVRVNNEEIKFFSQFVAHLNSVVKQAAAAAGVTYVDVEKAFVGHRLCETVYSNIAANGVTNGSDLPGIFGGPIGNESFHPNQMGHRLFKQTVLEQTQNFTVNNPDPNPNQSPPEGTPDFLNSTRSGRPIYYTNYDNDLGNNIMYREEWWRGTVVGIGYALPAGALFDIWLHSEPVHLGSFRTDPSGNLSFDVKVPVGIPTGFHTIHVKGRNMAGELVDIYKTLYVGASQSDLDGDGIPNDAELCLAFNPAGIDEDQDGIDDACDGQITEPPLPASGVDTNIDSTPESNSLSTESTNGTSLLPVVQQAASIGLASQISSTPRITANSQVTSPASISTNPPGKVEAAETTMAAIQPAITKVKPTNMHLVIAAFLSLPFVILAAMFLRHRAGH